MNDQGNTLRVWCPEDEDEPAVANSGLSPRESATDFAGDRWTHADYPDVQIVHVRDAAGNLTRWVVEARHEVSFYATPAHDLEPT